MGFELNRLMQQYGVSTPGMMNAPMAPVSPVAPQALAADADEAAKKNFAEATAAYNAALAAQPAAMEAYKANLAAYQPYAQEYQQRLRETPMYLQPQFTRLQTTPLAESPQTIEQMYKTYLGREPEEAGLAHWRSTFGPGAIGTTQRQQFLQGAIPELTQRGMPLSGEQFYRDTGNYWGNQLRSPTFTAPAPVPTAAPVVPPPYVGVPDVGGDGGGGGGNGEGGGGGGGGIADTAPGGQGVSNTAAGLGLTMMGVPAFGLTGLGVNVLGSLIAGQQANAMGQAAQTLSDMSAVPGITTISDPSGNVFGVSSPASIAAADAAIFGTSLTPSEESEAAAMAAIAEANAAANGPSDGTGPGIGDSVSGVGVDGTDGGVSVYRQGGLAKMKRFDRGGLNSEADGGATPFGIAEQEEFMRQMQEQEQRRKMFQTEAAEAAANTMRLHALAQAEAAEAEADAVARAEAAEAEADAVARAENEAFIERLRRERQQYEEPSSAEAAPPGAALPVSIAEMAKNYDVAPATEVERLAASYGVQPSSEAAPAVALPVTPAAPVTTAPAATPAEMPLAAPPATTTPVSPAALDLATLLQKYTTEESTYGPELREARQRANAETAAFQKMIAEAMKQETAPTDKAEMYFRLAAAFGAPTKSGHFAESLGLVGKELGEMKKEERATKRAERQARLQLGLEAQKLKTQAAKEELGTLRTLASEEMKDKRAILTEYLKSGRPQSEAGKMAEDAGLTRGTPEYIEFVNKYIDEKITSGNAIREAMVLIAQGNLNVAQAGLGVRQSAEQRAVEKETRESGQLSPAELKLKLEAEQSVGGLNDSMSALRRAYSLNPQTFDATLLDIGRQKLLEQTNPNDPRVLATREQANLLSKGAIEKLRSSFGGNPTEGERAALLALEGMDSKSKEERARIMRNTFDLLKARRDRENKRLQDIVSGKYRQKSTSEPEGLD